MKYVDILPEKGGLDVLPLAERIVDEFFPDIHQALARRDTVLTDYQVIAWALDLLRLAHFAAALYYKNHTRVAPKVRMLLEIEEDGRCYVFVVAYSLDDQPLMDRKECPVGVIGANAEDYEELKKKYPNVHMGFPGKGASGSN